MSNLHKGSVLTSVCDIEVKLSNNRYGPLNGLDVSMYELDSLVIYHLW